MTQKFGSVWIKRRIISADKSLFDAINDIVSNQYVLIQDILNSIKYCWFFLNGKL